MEARQSRREKLGGLAALVVAVAIAGGVTAYLFLSGDDGSDPVEGGGIFPPATGTPAPMRDDLGPLVPNRPEVGKPAPDFALIDARDGSVRKLSDFRGRAVIVNWYASWCGPCRDEIPDFNRMLETVGEDRVIVLGIDYQESASNALSILEEFGASYPALLDSNAAVADHYRVGNKIPSSFFVDADGILRSQQLGVVDGEDLARHLESVGISYTPPD